MKQKLMILASVLALALSAAPDAEAQWVQTSGQPNMGRIYSFVVSGTALFAGTDNGVFRSTDSGTSWNIAITGLPGSYILALAVRDTNLFAGTSDSGVFLSTNNGMSWRAVNSGITKLTVGALTVKGANVFTGTIGGGIFRSSDNGASWESIDSGLKNSSVQSFSVDSTYLFAGTFGGVFLSSDDGTTWIGVSNGITNLYVNTFALFDRKIFLGTDGASGGVFVSTNNGSSWIQRNSGLSNTYINALATSGSKLFARVGFGSGSGVFLSTNDGSSWAAVNEGLPLETWIYSLAMMGPSLIAGTFNDGIWIRPVVEMINPDRVELDKAISSSIAIYPNPLTRSTTINFTAPESGAAEIWVVNLLGAEVAQIYSGEMNAGEHSFLWNKPTGLPPGTYWCEVRMNGMSDHIPIVVQP